MTAESIGIFTIEFPDPYSSPAFDSDDSETVPLNESFRYPITYNIQTLSTKNVERGDDPHGILYVPDLHSDACKKAEQQYIASNATRLRNLPHDTDYTFVAFAPWFSSTCMHEYLASARSAATKALIVYQPGTNVTLPPPMNDPSWGLDDGGVWKSANTFPTYAIMSASGGIVANQLSLYSGNLTDVPYGRDLSAMYAPSDYVRLWANISTSASTQLPSLWVFLVIILGLLILIIIVTSVSMHVIQRRRRNDLRRRIILGEVNLEALGVKRLAVPQDYLEKLPRYTYARTATEQIEEKELSLVPNQDHGSAPVGDTGIKEIARYSVAPTVTDPPNFSQSVCPICIEDFEHRKTMVRELPCRHIFHPDCIDTFLLHNSSLCPLCKTSVLPAGYCPTHITNVMVRRERIMRRRRTRLATIEQIQNEQRSGGSSDAPASRGPVARMLTDRRIFSAGGRWRSRPSDIEMAQAAASPQQAADPQDGTPITETATGGQNQGSGDLAPERASNLLDTSTFPAHDQETFPESRWKRGFRKVFPGFR